MTSLAMVLYTLGEQMSKALGEPRCARRAELSR